MNGLPIWVVDASVLLKWLLPAEQEEHVLQADAIRDALCDGQVELRSLFEHYGVLRWGTRCVD